MMDTAQILVFLIRSLVDHVLHVQFEFINRLSDVDSIQGLIEVLKTINFSFERTTQKLAISFAKAQISAHREFAGMHLGADSDCQR